MTSHLARSGLALASALILAHAAQAHEKTVCYSSSVAIQPTDWSSSVAIPKFDPLLGNLASIRITLSAHVEGTAAVENTSTSSRANTTLQFSSAIQLSRPDLSVIVTSTPQASFADTLTVFDGTIDFGGTSGISHTGVVADDSDFVEAVIPSPDLALFSGTGDITLPVAAAGTSAATGSGNLVASFTQSASAIVQVCYTFEPNEPPIFDGPCDQTIMASAGVPLSFLMCASDAEPRGDVLTLTSGPLPPGATLTPPLPISGNPVCTQFDWTPSPFDAGTHTITFTVTDSFNESLDCTVTIVVAECYHLIGRGDGNANILLGGHLFPSQMNAIRTVFPVTMEDHPALRVPILTTGQIRFSMQTVMFNPVAFPANPDQWSRRLRVTIGPFGQVDSELLGDINGIHQQVRTFTNPAGTLFMTFPFTIDGM